MKLTGIKAVFFDFDDTLGDREYYAYECAKTILKKSTDIKDPIVFESILQDWMLWDEKGNIDKEHVRHMLKQKYDIDLYCSDINTAWDESLWKYCRAFDDAADTLSYLQSKYKLCVITNGPSLGQRKKLEVCGLDRFFAKENIIVSGDYDYGKPDVRIFQQACRSLGVKPEESVYIGDIYANDVQGSSQAGMTPIWMWTAGNRRQSTDILTIHHLSELKEIL